MKSDIPTALTVSEAAEEYEVSRQRIHQLMATYDVKPYRLANGTYLIPLEELKKIPKKRKNGIKTVR